MFQQIQTLTEYFECDLRLRNDDHTFLGKVYLRLLPRIGEGMQTVLPGEVEVRRFTVSYISHVAGTSTTNHTVTIYLTEGDSMQFQDAMNTAIKRDHERLLTNSSWGYGNYGK